MGNIFRCRYTLLEHDFTIRIFDIGDDVPAVPPFYESDGGNVPRTSKGEKVVGAYDSYEYWVEVDPIVLDPNTFYLLSIISDTEADSDGNWYWLVPQSRVEGNLIGMLMGKIGWKYMMN